MLSEKGRIFMCKKYYQLRQLRTAMQNGAFAMSPLTNNAHGHGATCATSGDDLISRFDLDFPVRYNSLFALPCSMASHDSDAQQQAHNAGGNGETSNLSMITRNIVSKKMAGCI